jgi:hypothetical protein
MPKTLISAVLCELVHCHGRGALFLQSTFLVILFICIPHLPQNFQIISLINYLAHCNELMIKNTMIMFSSASVLVLFWDAVNHNSSIAMTDYSFTIIHI